MLYWWLHRSVVPGEVLLPLILVAQDQQWYKRFLIGLTCQWVSTFVALQMLCRRKENYRTVAASKLLNRQRQHMADFPVDFSPVGKLSTGCELRNK